MTSRKGFSIVRARDIMLRVRAKPGAREDRIAGVRSGNLLVEIRAAPERGRANEAVSRVLADALGLRVSDVVLKYGASAPRKTFILPLSALPAIERLERETT